MVDVNLAQVPFPLDLQLTGTTDVDVAMAIVANTKFPSRPDGTIPLGHIGLSTKTATPLRFDAAGMPVTVQASAGVAASAGIFTSPKAALDSLQLGETPGLDLTIDAKATDRFALLTTSYTASGAVSGTHPIGAIGSLSVGVSAAAAGELAVMHRFDVERPSREVLTRTVAGFGLPRNVKDATSLKPGTWLIGEADGSLAVNVSAKLGYNMDFVRRLKAGPLAGDVGLKLDAALSAAFGLEVSGRYVLVVGRESEAETVRVRLFKLAHKGISFGLNLKAGVTGVEKLTPATSNDLIKAVFGVHGVQIATALARIEQWTDPKADVGALVAGLVNDKALALLKDLTGKDPATEFNAARQIVVRAIQKWRGLGPAVSSEVWTILGEKLTAKELAVLKDGLTTLAATGPTERRAFADLISQAGLSSPLVRILNAAADHGVLSLIDRLPQARAIASDVLDVLNGTVITNLQKYVEERLGLDRVMAAVTRTDFAALDSWLVGRLAGFFDKAISFDDLAEIRGTIHAAIAREQEIYAKVQKALNSRYGLEVAATWQRTTADTAVFDVEFDTADAAGKALLQGLLIHADLDAILTSRAASVHLHAGVLTHVVTRKQTVNVSLPHVDLQTQTMNQALASVQVDASGPGILAYQASGNDVVTQKNRYRSTLAVSVAATIDPANASPDLRIHALDGTWSYELLVARPAMRRHALEETTRPFIKAYMASQFGGATTLPDWYRQLDDSIESRLHNGPDVFGDVCLSEEVTLPNAPLAAWFRRSPDARASAKAIAIAIQRSLKEVVLFYYLSDVARLKNLAEVAAVLTWASIPPANGPGNDVLWDHRDPPELTAMLNQAQGRLAAQLKSVTVRLEEAQMNGELPFYAEGQASQVRVAAQTLGFPLLDALLVFESSVVLHAVDAFKEAQAFISTAAPSKALERLAAFAADITTAFNTLAGQAPFAGPSLRAVSQSVFIEAARAIDPALNVRPSAMLTLSVLAPVRTFDIGRFTRGELPPANEVVLGQRLVAVS